MLTAVDKAGWPIVPGARIRGDRGYSLRRRSKPRQDVVEDDFEAALDEAPASAERYVPTDECVVVAVLPRPKTGGVRVLARCTTTHGLRDFTPERVTVVAGDSSKSAVVRELVEAKIVKDKKAERKAAVKAADREAREMKKRSRPVPQEAAKTDSSAPLEESRQVDDDLSFLD